MTLRIGISGCGRAAEQLHLPAIETHPHLAVVVASDTQKNQLEKVADAFGIQHRYTDFQLLIEQANIDIAAVCVPVQFHHEIAKCALMAGKHLLIEKPLTLTLAEADELIEIAEKSRVKILVGFNLRRHRLIQAAKAMIAAGRLGKITAIRSQWTSAIRYRQELPAWRSQRKLGGGALFEIAVHHFDLWRCLTGSEITEICAHSGSQNFPDETAAVTAAVGGIVASGVFSEQTADHNEIEIIGSKGRLRVNLFRFDGLEFFPIDSPPGGIGQKVNEMVNFIKALPTGIAIVRQGGDFLNSYYNEWDYFSRCIRENLAVDCGLKDGRASLQTVLTAIKSTHSRKVELMQKTAAEDIV